MNKILKFGADWCAPCRAIAPLLKQIASEYEGKIEIEDINVDTEPELSIKYEVTAIPKIVYLKDDEVVKVTVGAQTKSSIKANIAEFFGV